VVPAERDAQFLVKTRPHVLANGKGHGYMSHMQILSRDMPKNKSKLESNRVETKVFVFVFSRKLSLFATKYDEKSRK
jgi:hypothetical protein